ncbi:MAG: NAD(P)-binding domain-containing protein, partial [Stellaceae bacterium]
MANIGFIGLGIMGAPMAGHLIAGGHRVTTSTHHKPAPKALVDQGLATQPTPAAVAREAEIVITMLPDTPDVA